MPPPPPPAKKPSKAKRSAFDTATETAAKIEELKQHSAASYWYDKDSPAVRSRREVTRADFEYFVKKFIGDEDATLQDIYNRDNIIERTKSFLHAYARNSKGKIGIKPRVDALFHQKDAILWTLMRIIPNFLSIFGEWHTQCTAHISYIGKVERLETASYDKHNLGAAELRIFWSAIHKERKGGLNWKQHYTAWVMVFMCSVRPGSFTVCPGYAKGDPTGLPGEVRDTDDTLRWNDIEFIRFPKGIGLRIK